MILFRISRFFGGEESVWSKITNPRLDSPKKNAPKVRGWSHKPGWLSLPRWLLSRYYMKRARPEPSLYRDLKQCAWAVSYQLSCLSLGSFAGRPVSVITCKISTRDLGITILGCQLTGLARLSCKDFRRGTASPHNKQPFFDSLVV